MAQPRSSKTCRGAIRFASNQKTACLIFAYLRYDSNEFGGALLRDRPQCRSLSPSHCSKCIKDRGPEKPMFIRRKRQQSEPDVSPELREQIVNIVDDFVDEIALGYLPPNSIFPLNYREAIYEKVYKELWSKFGQRRFANVNYRDEIFDFLREVPSEIFFNVTEHLLKVIYGIVHIRIAIPDDIILNPSAGNKLWSRKKSVRDRHISRFKGAVDILNHRLFENNVKYRYKLEGEFFQMVRLDTLSDVRKKGRGIEKKDDNQTPEHNHIQSRSEIWGRKNYTLGFVMVVLAILEFAIGDGILIPLLQRVWNYLQTFL